MSDLTLSAPSGAFHADVTVPGDKSLSHRALIVAAMARGRSRVTGLGPGADVAATARAIAALGVDVDGDEVVSPGVASWSRPAEVLDIGNSGTSIRLLAGALSGRPFRSTLTGDASIQRRPMRRLVEPLGALGAVVEVSDDGTAPITVEAGPDGLVGAEVAISIASAQIRTAIALAALQAMGATTISSPPGYRDHTERWFRHLGLGAETDDGRFEVRPGPVPTVEIEVPGDPSSAAYLWAAAALRSESTVTTRRVSLNPGRIGFLEVLAAMGATVEIEPTGDVVGDPVGDVRVVGDELRGAAVGGDLAVRSLDELPLLAIVAAAAEGRTVVRDAEELRVKESDRIATTVAMVRALGGTAEATDDGFVIEGGGRLDGGSVDAATDHRLAMSAAVAATVSAGSVTVRGFDAAAVSWPGMERTLESVWSSR